MMLRPLAIVYAVLLYGFIFLPVAVLVLFSFQGTLFPIPPFNGPSLRWYAAVLGDARLTSGLLNSVAVALVTSAIATLRAESWATPVPSLIFSVWAAIQVRGVNASEPQDSAVQTESKPTASAWRTSSTGTIARLPL